MKFLSNKINEEDESVLEDEENKEIKEDKKINFEESQMEQSVEENQIEEIEEESRIYFKIEEFNSKIENIKNRANIKSNNPPEIVQRKCDLLKAFYENRMEIEPV
ncbi:hypothetical protein HERIO_1495 [Hepatospora eriocheir]|uniref:Uncharacterized protein n=1 Tax=Hepatospora eriocheir TaxID=1081669 RepID=A0A1X0Q9Y3_9MICR|nr:hypothetical protein HERIO_1495 [Hepatospora eriocheir]